MTVVICISLYIMIGSYLYLNAVQDSEIGWPPRESFWTCTIIAVLLWPVPFLVGLYRLAMLLIGRNQK